MVTCQEAEKYKSKTCGITAPETVMTLKRVLSCGAKVTPDPKASGILRSREPLDRLLHLRALAERKSDAAGDLAARK